MSFPARGPPLLPGVPRMPLMQGYPMPSLMQPTLVSPVVFTPRPATTATAVTVRAPVRTQPQPTSYQRRTKEPLGPPVTVFIGNITERAPDGMVRLILNSCGTVHSWKRVQGASGRLQAFGFCEFGNPDAALRSIRVLHDLEISDKKLVAKVDAKTQEVLEKYKDEKRKKQRKSPLQDEAAASTDSDDYIDDDMRADDDTALKRIKQILSDYAQEMANYTPRGRREGRKRSEAAEKERQRAHEKVIELGKSGVTVDNQPANLDGMEVEEDKKDLISREIGKFRDMMKRQEEEKERTRRERGESPGGSASRTRRPATRSRSREPREVTPTAPPPRRPRTRTRSRSRSPSTGSALSGRSRPKPDDSKRRSRSRDAVEIVPRKSEREVKREREEEEEIKERKKLDRKAREKEAAYQERLRNWETREQKRQREVKKEAEREKQREEEALKEAKKLKEFLEDYDDEKDDPKYYKGRELQRRLAAREREVEEDAKDRQREKEELDELRDRINTEGHKDPAAEYERQRAEREERYRPRLLVKPDRPPQPATPELVVDVPPVQPEPPQQQQPVPTEARRAAVSPPPPPEDSQAASVISVSGGGTPGSLRADSASRTPADPSPSPLAPPTPVTPSTAPPDQPPPTQQQPPPVAAAPAPQPPPTAGRTAKKKKLDVRDVFNQDDDDVQHKKKRKLVPLDHDDDAKRKEEKKRAVKMLIEKIPTGKEELFNYAVNWDVVDNNLMERRIRPWINKKIAEYIGEPEPTLVEFICSKILVGSTPQAILDDVQMVLDEEADVFVVKMWRLLIYEIEAKKHGLGK